MAEEKPGGFGSLPGDLFDELIQYFGAATTSLSTVLQPIRLEILVELALAEHAAANAKKDPYVVDVVFKCLLIRSELPIAKNASLADQPDRENAMKKIKAALTGLKQLWA